MLFLSKQAKKFAETASFDLRDYLRFICNSFTIYLQSTIYLQFTYLGLFCISICHLSAIYTLIICEFSTTYLWFKCVPVINLHLMIDLGFFCNLSVNFLQFIVIYLRPISNLYNNYPEIILNLSRSFLKVYVNYLDMYHQWNMQRLSKNCLKFVIAMLISIWLQNMVKSAKICQNDRRRRLRSND